MEKITFDVQGMSCGHCVNSIKRSVGTLSGVSLVEGHLDSGKVDVEFQPNEVNLETIKETIENQGYEVA